jgi:hypothetical protein
MLSIVVDLAINLIKGVMLYFDIQLLRLFLLNQKTSENVKLV